ncbi:MAG: hypothetical protein FWC00_05470 [Firmicutes bacterium]|nr:hypothetical protein [Bacillota bacterium]
MVMTKDLFYSLHNVKELARVDCSIIQKDYAKLSKANILLPVYLLARDESMENIC